MIDEVFIKFDPRVLPVFTFIRETGSRKGEAITLERSQIGFARAQVVFNSNTKNGRSRLVPLTESTLRAIAAMSEQADTVYYSWAQFGKPEIEYKGKRICITGKAKGHNETAFLDVKSPSQVQIDGG